MAEPIEISVPGSKSQTQRALVIAALAPGLSTLVQPLVCDDSRHLRAALRALGVEIEEENEAGDERWQVHGGALRAPAAPIYCGDGGTTLRFLAPLALLLDGPLALDGSARLRERPLAELLRALAPLGLRAVHRGVAGALPLELSRHGAPGAQTSVDVSQSSQFASALLLLAPLLPGGLELELSGEAVSRPYLELTLEMMRAQGAQATWQGSTIRVAPGSYRAGELAVEGDWSSAAFLLAAGFISGREVHVRNVDVRSAQGDRAMVGLLEELRRPRPHHFDLTDCPDLIAPLAAAAVCAAHPVEIGGAAHARLKESDRPAVLVAGLRQVGVDATEHADGLALQPAPTLTVARLDPHGDHRMAMAFGLLSLRQPGIEVLDRGCVEKSYPSFWQHLERFA